MKKRMIFISSALQQPRHQKRINSLSKSYDLTVIYSVRDLYRENLPNLEVNSIFLGYLKNRRYLLRFTYIFKLFYHLLKLNVDLIYCTTIEQAFIALLLRKQVILEQGDIQQFGKYIGFWKIIDSYLIKRLKGIVLTSPGYIQGYYSTLKGFNSLRYLIYENKLPVSLKRTIELFRTDYQFESSNIINLGIIGALSQKRKLIELKQALEKRADVHLHIFGDGYVDVFKGMKNHSYHGVFKNPDDLVKIYNMIDINVIFYDSNDENVKYALPNKLYESIAFLKPILCSPNCILNDYVKKFDIGESAEASDINKKIDKIIDNYKVIQSNLMQLDSSQFIENDHELLKFVQSSYINKEGL